MKKILIGVLLFLSQGSVAQVGDWPVEPSLYSYFGAVGLNHSNAANYAMIQDKTNGLTFLNSPYEIRFRIGNIDKFFLDNSGKLGIGTTSPFAKAHINIVSSNTSYSSLTTDDISLAVSNSSNTNNNINVISFLDAAGWGVAHVGATTLSQSGHTGKLFFSTRPSGSGPVQRMVIDENGLVGIGHAPVSGFMLAVGGNTIAERMVIKLQANWPDYVFEKSYALPALDAVKSYIEENKHLPEVPSAKEMEAKGIDVGEMNMLLLKKVEELTLYQIESNRQILELSKTIRRQRLEIKEIKSKISKN